MLTLTHHVHEFIGAYWYSLEGEILDSEGNTINVGEGSPKLTKINRAVKFYKDNGFYDAQLRHNVVLETN